MGRPAKACHVQLREHSPDAVIVDLPGAKVRSLNEKPWSIGAARGAAAGRRRLRELAAIASRASIHDLPVTNGAFPKPLVPITVTIFRVSLYKLDDDNLIGACKAIRDGVADAFGLKDNSPLLEWRYDQCKAQEIGVNWKLGIRIVLEPLPDSVSGSSGGPPWA